MKRQLFGAVIGLWLLNPLAALAAADMNDEEYQAVYGTAARQEIVEDGYEPEQKMGSSTSPETDDAVAKKREATKHRYKKVAVDQNFTYYVDTKNMRWRYIPNSRQQMIDVWIKLLPYADYYSDGTAANYDTNYYLEHYLLYPKKQQIQFLSEIEVKGRPTNKIRENKFNMKNWEDLVPGSIEDTIYHAVMDCIEEMPSEGKKSTVESIGDGIEDVLRIAL